MGTLFEQPPRGYCDTHNFTQFGGSKSGYLITADLRRVRKIAIDSGCTVEQVLRFMQVKEDERRNNLYVANGDAWDEQIAGIGDILSRIADALSEANA